MGRLGSIISAASIPLLILTIAGLNGCGSNSAIKTTTYPVPATITLAPAPYVSLELGTTQAFTATLASATKSSITEPVFYQSTNTAVVTVAANGTACAGSWDNLANPQVCTPGPTGVAQITATAQGVTSAPTTIYVHQHVDSVVISIIPPINAPPPTAPCYSVGQSAEYQAAAYSNGLNITSTVGVFTWQSLNNNVLSLNTSLSNLQLGQVQVTAKVPGETQIFASIGTTNSLPLTFTTCAVQSISLQVTAASSTSKTITPTIIDSLGNTLTGVTLTWSSSQSASVNVSASGVASETSGGGGATIIASCTPPNCNTGFLPSQPIYPENAIAIIVNNTGSTSASSTLYASSTACGTTDSCVSTIVPITTPANTVGNFIALPATPNSLVFHRAGDKAYLGTDSGAFGTRGLMILDTGSNTVSQVTAAPGKVLAVSPDGVKVIVSDTTDTPNQVFVFDTSLNTTQAYSISGATAADFSPDSLKAYILAGSTLYVYSKLDALQTIPLSAPANEVAFFPEGAFAYIAGGTSSGVTVKRTCDNGEADTIATSATPVFIRSLPDAVHMLALTPPTLDIIQATTTPVGCTPTITDSVTSFDLGQGDFTAGQMIVSQDGSVVYILIPGLGSMVVFNVAAQTSSHVALAGNAIPIQASLVPDGSLLYVGSDDGEIHILQTATASDLGQIILPVSLCQNTAGQTFGITCNADLVAIKP